MSAATKKKSATPKPAPAQVKPAASDGLPKPRRYLAIGALSAGTALVIIDGGVANVALPTIARDLGVAEPRDRRLLDEGDPAARGDAVKEIKAFMAIGIDGIFSDSVVDAVAAKAEVDP